MTAGGGFGRGDGGGRLGYQIVVEGEEQAAAALKTVDAAFKAAEERAKLAGSAFDRAQQEMRQGAAGADQFARALRGGPAMAFPAITKESQNSGRSMGMLVNSVSEMTYSMGTAVPGMRTFAMQIAMLGGNAVTLGASFGPLGVAIATVVGLAPSLIGLFTDSGDEAAETTDRVAGLTAEFERYVSAVERGARRLQTAMAVNQGKASVDEQRAQVMALEASADRFNETFAQSLTALGNGTRQAREFTEELMRGVQSAGEGRAEQERAIEVAMQRVRSELYTSGGALGSRRVADIDQAEIARVERNLRSVMQMRRSIAAAQRNEATARQRADAEETAEKIREHQEELARLEREGHARRRSAGAGRATREREESERQRDHENEMERIAAQLKAKRDAADAAAVSAEREASDERMTAMAANKRKRDLEATASWERTQERVRESDRERERAHQEELRALNGQRQQAVDMLSTSAAGVTEALLSGEKDALHEKLEGMAKSEAVESVAAFAKAAGWAFFNPAAATGYATEGAMHAAAAALAGGAAAATAPSKASGGSGGQAQPGGPSPDRLTRSQGREGVAGPETIVVNVGTFPVATKADVGRAVVDALRAVNRRDGRRI